MTRDTQLHQLVINKLTTEQYNSAVQAGTIDETQLYMTTDSPNVTSVTVNGTSVVNDGVANIVLGSMATENKNNYPLDANVVHKTGDETINGIKTFTGNPLIKKGAPCIFMQNTAITKGTAPSTTQWSWYSAIYDSAGTAQANKLAQIYHSSYSGGAVDFCFHAFRPLSGSTESSGIRVGYSNSNSNSSFTEIGTVTATAPTPTESSTSSKQIDTVGARVTATNLKVDKVNTASRVYGTDSSGNQTTYDYNAIGKVDDVKVNGTSVVSNKIAAITLGTMATETASDYSTKAVADTLYAEKAIETTVANKVDKVSTASKIYGTNSSGNQTTYNLSDLQNKVTDVKVGNTSVVSSKVATLGTMASETATNYYKKTDLGTMALENTTNYYKKTDLATIATTGSWSNLSGTPTTISGYGITDAYTKTEIDGKLTGAMRFKGTKATVSALPSTGNVTGDMWNVTETGANYAWDGSTWDKLSENIDLSGFYTKTEADNRYVNVAGDTMTGNLTMTSGARPYIKGSRDFTTATASAADSIFRTTDSGNHVIGEIFNYFGYSATEGQSNTGWWIRSSNRNDSSKYADIRNMVSDEGLATLSYSVSGTSYNLTGVTNSTTNNHLATMGWVNNPETSTNVVHRSGDETIAGTKTFSSPINGTINTTAAAGSTKELLRASMASNDSFRLMVGGASNAGYVELATADDYNEPIYVRQYQGNFATLKRTATLLDANGNTQFPGIVTAPTFAGNLNGDNYIQWGGPNLADNVSPADAGCIDDFGHNKAAFWGGQIDAQYTLDGTTWTDISLTDYQKWALVTKGGTNVIVGNHARKATDGTLTNDNVANTRARITLHTVGADGNSKFYSKLKKILLDVSTMGAGGCKAKISTRTIENYNNNVDTWVDRGTYDVGGWSGWNSIPYIDNLGGYNNQTGYNADLRIEFWSTSVNSGYDCAMMIKDIRLIGVTNWVVDTVASTGYLYDYDNLKNAYFPADLNAVGTIKQNGSAVALDSNVVKLTGNQTVAGMKTFTSGVVRKTAGLGSDGPFTHQCTALTKGTAPSSSDESRWYLTDKNGTFGNAHSIGGVSVLYGTDGKISTYLTAFKPEASSTASASLSVHYPASGSAYTSAPIPTDTTSTSSSQIATVGWANTRKQDKLTAGTNITISNNVISADFENYSKRVVESFTATANQTDFVVTNYIPGKNYLSVNVSNVELTSSAYSVTGNGYTVHLTEGVPAGSKVDIKYLTDVALTDSGATFTPSVSKNNYTTTLSWSNDRGLNNPTTVKIYDGVIYTPAQTKSGNAATISWTNNQGKTNPSSVTLYDGATFTPSETISQDGNYMTLSWTNDRSLPNPQNVTLYLGQDNTTQRYVDTFTATANQTQFVATHDILGRNVLSVNIDNTELTSSTYTIGQDKRTVTISEPVEAGALVELKYFHNLIMAEDGATYTPAVTSTTGGYNLSWTNDKGLQNPSTVFINSVYAVGAYSASATYKAGNLVTYEDSNYNYGYIAKKAVPAGTSLSNTTYWTQAYAVSKTYIAATVVDWGE